MLVKSFQISNVYLQHLEHKQGTVGYQHYTWATVVGYLDLAEAVQVVVCSFEVQYLQVAALK